MEEMVGAAGNSITEATEVRFIPQFINISLWIFCLFWILY
jgi:hypothetical protein